MDKENILYYQSNIKTSRNEDSVYAMKYANQQMLIDKLEQQCKKQKEVIDKVIEKTNDYKIYCRKEKGFTEYTDIEIEAIEPVISELEDILKEVE